MTTATKPQIDFSEVLSEALYAEAKLGNTYNRFYRYSFMNQIMLMIQGAKGPVATYKRWGDLGYQVRKGEKSKAIFRPSNVKIKDVETGEEVGGFTRFYLKNCLFDLSQVDGPLLLDPEPTSGYNLEAALSELKVTREEFHLIDGNTQGYAQERSFAISPVAVYPLKTTFHELGHIVLGHTSEGNEEHRGVREFQAEAVAYLVLTQLGERDWDKVESRAYIKGWLKDEQPSEKQIRAIFSAVDKILKAGGM